MPVPWPALTTLAPRFGPCRASEEDRGPDPTAVKPCTRGSPTPLTLHLFALRVSEGALDAMFRRAKRRFDGEAAAIPARLRRARVVCSDETTVRVAGRTHWDRVFRNEQVVIHVIRPSRGRAVVAGVLGGHRPEI